MVAALIPVLLVGYLFLGVAFLVATRGAAPRVKWLGLASILAAAPFFYWLGAFSEQFGSGQCYSRIVGTIANSAEHSNSPKELAQHIRALPMHGYETDCSEVEIAAKALPHAIAP